MPRREVHSSDKDSGQRQDVAPSVVAEEQGPACLPCRKKKSKCSRSQPCSHCVKASVECVFDDHKSRPGMRVGALDALTERVKTLESMFLGQGLLWQQVWNCLDHVQSSNSTLSSPSSSRRFSSSNERLRESTERLKSTLTALSNGETNGILDDSVSRNGTNKRRRPSQEDSQESSRKRSPVLVDSQENALPPDDLVDSLVEIYFTQIQPWIPILHVRGFRERMKDPMQRPKLKSVFHAIVSLCSRFSDDPRLSDPEVRAQYARKNRQIVILQSMESFSVENLQALVICAFDTIGSGRGPSAWSIVGSMTRTVEQLQLSVEENDSPEGISGEFLMQRMAFLKPCKSWLEREERRRVFWNVFLMDRFCSIATGWNVSLTSADVKRRLPCEGALWERGIPLETPTPFFGISDVATTTPKISPDLRQDRSTQDSIGAFAYCIEATESLSLITMFFLRQPVDFSNFHDVQVWMMRFKELDLRLIQWKLFLPEKWREASARNADGVLDPNLILAHITHNTAVGLLHQGIAYPSPQWQRTKIKLLSASSAETCLAAASEIAIIAKNFLIGSTILTNPQFAFCLFISGRMLLAHSNYHSVVLSDDFDSLTDSLLEISRRWNGARHDPFKTKTDNLASKFAARLIQAKNEGAGALDIRKAAYSEEEGQRTANGSPLRVGNDVLPVPPHVSSMPNGNFPPYAMTDTRNPLPTGVPLPSNGTLNDQSMHNPLLDQSSPDSISLAFPPLPLSFHPQNASTIPSPAAELAHLPSDAGYPPNMEGYNPELSMNLQGGYAQTPALNGFGTSLEEYENLNSFFQYPFIPSQRISTFLSAEKKD